MAKERFRSARRGYTTLTNVFLDNKLLTLEAKGLLAIICSNDRDTFDLKMTEIFSRSKNGRDKHYKVINELIEHKYFARIKIKDDKNRFVQMDYCYSDQPQEVLEMIKEYDGQNVEIEYGKKLNEPLPEIQDTGNTDTGNQDINNTNINNPNNNKQNNGNFSVDNQLPLDMLGNIDDDKPSFQKAKYNEQQVTYIIDKLTLQFKAYMNMKSINAIIRKVKHKFENGQVSDLQEYLFTSLNNKLIELETKRMKEEETKFVKEDSKEEYKPMGIPFYNWLEEKK